MDHTSQPSKEGLCQSAREGLRPRESIWSQPSGSHLYHLMMMFMLVSSYGSISLHWGNFQPSVKWQKWELPPLSPRVQFSPGKGWSTHSKSEMSYLPKWKYSRPNSQVKGEWIDRETGAASAMIRKAVICYGEERGESNLPADLCSTMATVFV